MMIQYDNSGFTQCILMLMCTRSTKVKLIFDQAIYCCCPSQDQINLKSLVEFWCWIFLMEIKSIFSHLYKYLRACSPQLIFSSVQFSSDQFSSVQFNSVQFNSVQFRSVQFKPVQFSSALDNTFTLTYHYSFQFSSVQFRPIQFRSDQFSSVQFSCFMPKRTGPQSNITILLVKKYVMSSWKKYYETKYSDNFFLI